MKLLHASYSKANRFTRGHQNIREKGKKGGIMPRNILNRA